MSKAAKKKGSRLMPDVAKKGSHFEELPQYLWILNYQNKPGIAIHCREILACKALARWLISQVQIFENIENDNDLIIEISKAIISSLNKSVYTGSYKKGDILLEFNGKIEDNKFVLSVTNYLIFSSITKKIKNMTENITFTSTKVGPVVIC
jgi:hypothetical protein